METDDKTMEQMARDAHYYCTYHRKKLVQDKLCGCFDCLTIFNPIEIKEWCDKDQTAICPYCGIDSIIGKSSGYPITIKFMKRMQKIWF